MQMVTALLKQFKKLKMLKWNNKQHEFRTACLTSGRQEKNSVFLSILLCLTSRTYTHGPYFNDLSAWY